MAVAPKVYYATGRRKTSTARVFLKPGSGKVIINDLALDKYMMRKTGQMIVMQPLEATSMQSKVDIFATVEGGGESSQAGAVRHGISRALVVLNSELRSTLRKLGFMTRDPRMKERKKYGQRAARARYQYSKR